MGCVEDDPWSVEDEYLENLAAERARFAWVMRVYGEMSAVEADASAERCYPYQAPGPYRGLVFHDDAWHWAMLQLKGEGYCSRFPELVHPPQAYHALD
jgi:hypothetical protein